MSTSQSALNVLAIIRDWELGRCVIPGLACPARLPLTPAPDSLIRALYFARHAEHPLGVSAAFAELVCAALVEVKVELPSFHKGSASAADWMGFFNAHLGSPAPTWLKDTLVGNAADGVIRTVRQWKFDDGTELVWVAPAFSGDRGGWAFAAHRIVKKNRFAPDGSPMQIEGPDGVLVNGRPGFYSLTPAGVQALDGETTTTRPKADTRKWTKKTADAAIRKLAEERADEIRAAAETVKRGERGAAKLAAAAFGRNAVMRELGCSAALVTNSRAWQVVANRLGLRSGRTPGVARGERIGMEVAVDNASVERDRQIGRLANEQEAEEASDDAQSRKRRARRHT